MVVASTEVDRAKKEFRTLTRLMNFQTIKRKKRFMSLCLKWVPLRVSFLYLFLFHFLFSYVFSSLGRERKESRKKNWSIKKIDLTRLDYYELSFLCFSFFFFLMLGFSFGEWGSCARQRMEVNEMFFFFPFFLLCCP